MTEKKKALAGGAAMLAALIAYLTGNELDPTMTDAIVNSGIAPLGVATFFLWKISRSLESAVRDLEKVVERVLIRLPVPTNGRDPTPLQVEPPPGVMLEQ